MIALRPYQHTAIGEVRARIRRGKRRVLLVLATGGGKTVVASSIIESACANGNTVLFLAHRKELIDQTVKKLAGFGFDGSRVGVIRAQDDRKNPRAPVQVASVQTLVNRPVQPWDLIIVDEAHRSLAPSYAKTVERVNAERAKLTPPRGPAVVLGLTATPYRADGRGLGAAYDDLVAVASPRVLIDEGFLVEPRIYSTPRKLDLSGVATRGADYDGEELAALMDQRALTGDIVEHWRQHLDGVRTVVFACSVEHSRHIAERFREANIPAEHLDGETPEDVREAILARLDSGETLVVSNCSVLCEGWDQPAVKGLVLARPTKSTALYLQMAGRILRPWAGDPAQPAVILDHAGAVHEHGFPQDDREYTLEDKPKKRAAAPSVKTCDACFMALPARTRICPGCGRDFGADEPDERAELPEQEGQLVELKPLTTEEKRALFDDLCAVAEEKKYKPGWVFYRYREAVGCAPPAGWKVPGARAPEACTAEDKAAEWERLCAMERERQYRRGWAWARYRAKFGEAPATSRPVAVASEPNDPAPRAPSLDVAPFLVRVEAIELPGEAVRLWQSLRPELSEDVRAKERVWRALIARVAVVGRIPEAKRAAVWLKKAIAEDDARRAYTEAA